MTAVWSTCLVVGLVLGCWALRSLPAGTCLQPVAIQQRSSRGPYRWLDHPMYVGNVLLVVGAAGLAAGGWNALACGTLAELLMRDWIFRETGGRA